MPLPAHNGNRETDQKIDAGGTCVHVSGSERAGGPCLAFEAWIAGAVLRIPRSQKPGPGHQPTSIPSGPQPFSTTIMMAARLTNLEIAMYCVHCGTQNPSYARFCLQCGKLLERKEEPPSDKKPTIIAVGTAQQLSHRSLAKLEIRPKTNRNVLFLVIGCFVFTVAGFFMISTGEVQNIAVGILSIVFFGGGGLITAPKLMRRKISMVLSEQGVEQIAPLGSAFIPWADVEKLGTTSMYGNVFVGFRLSSYDQYIESMSPELSSFMRKSMPYLKLIARAAALLPVPQAIALWSKLKGETDLPEALKALGKIGSLVEALMWSRQQFGYDILIGWSDRDRSAPKFLELLEEYRALSRA
jgi:hypothetical protein